MADNDSMIKLTAALDKEKSTKQINQDIKTMEKTINQLRLMAMLYKDESKKEINASIQELENKVNTIHLKASFDRNKIKAELDEAFNSISLKDINIKKQGIEIAARKIARNLNSVLSKLSVSPKIDINQETTKRDLTGIQNKVSMVTAAFGLTISAISKFKQSMGTLKDISVILNNISKASGMTQEEMRKLGKESFQIAGTYGKSSKDYLLSVLSMARSGYGMFSRELGELSLLAQSTGTISAETANSFIKSIDAAYQYSGNITELTKALDGLLSISQNSNISFQALTTAVEATALSAANAGIGIDQLAAAEAALMVTTNQAEASVNQSFQSILDGLESIKNSSDQLTEPVKLLEEMSKTSLYGQLLTDFSNSSGTTMNAFAEAAANWEIRITSLQNAWDYFIFSLTSQEQAAGAGSFLEQTLLSFEKLEETIARIPQMIAEINTSVSSIDVQNTSNQDSGSKASNKDSLPSITPFDFKSMKDSAEDFRDISESVDKLEEKLIKSEYGFQSFSGAIAENHTNLKNYLATCSSEAPASLSGYQDFLTSTGVETDLLRAKTILLNAAFSGISAIAMQVVSMAIASVGQAIYDHFHQVEIAAAAAEESERKLSELRSKYEALNNKLKETADRLQELKSKDNLSFVEQEELNNLTKSNEELERQLLVTKALKDISAKDSRNKSVDYFNAETHYEVLTGTASLPQNRAGAPVPTPQYGIENGTQLDKISSEINEYSKLQSDLEDKKKEIDSLMQSNPDGYKKSKKYRDLVKEQSILDGRIEALGSSLSEEIPEMMQHSATLDPNLDKNLISQINSIYNLFIRSSKDISSTEKFNNVWNSPDFSESRKRLESQAESGDLNAKYPVDFDYVSLIAESGLSPQEILDKINASLKDKINSEKNDFKKVLLDLPANELDEYISKFKSGDLNEDSISSFKDLNKIIETTGVSTETALKNIEDISNTHIATPELLAEMDSLSQLMNSVEQEYNETGEISSSNLNAIANQFPEMQNAVLEYNQQLIGSDDFMAQLHAAYEQDAEAYRINMVYKLENDETFFSTVRKRNQDLFADLAMAYGQDLENWKTLVGAKSGIDIGFQNIVLDTVGVTETNAVKRNEIADKYYKVQEDGSYLIDQNAINNLPKEQQDKINEYAATAKNDKEKVEKAANANIIVPKISHSPARTGTSKNSSPQTRDFDWTDRYQKSLDDTHSRLKEAASNSYIDYLGISEEDFNRGKEILSSTTAPTLDQLEELKNMAETSGLSMSDLYRTITGGTWTASRQSILEQLVESDKNALEEQKKIIDQYQSQYNTALSKINPDFKSKIENGNLSTDKLSGKEAEDVQAAITAYDKLKASKEKQNDLQKNYTESFMASYENRSAAIKAENDEIKASSNLIEKQIAYIKSSGELVDASLYEKLIQQSNQQENNTTRLIENKRKEMQDILSSGLNSENSETYYKLKQEVNDAESSLYDLQKAQEEYNFQLLKMPIENMATVTNMYKDIQSAMENWNSELEASGKKADNNFYQKMISNGFTLIDQYKEQAGLIEEAMDNYSSGSDNWNELYGKLQSVNSEMSSMVQNLHKWNEELLKMPLDKISNTTSDLQNIMDGLESVRGEYDTVISAVTGAINEQIKTINEQKDAVNEEYEASKKSLQDKLDLLNKQNEELKLQQKYEQSLYDLQKANQQATEKVIRDGQVVYEQDADKLRQAKEAVQDAKFNLETNAIQTQINSLQETLDGLNDKYQDQLDSLQKISDKWSEISEKITQAQNEAKAGEILGDNWKDKVLSGNDTDLIKNFSGMYTGISEQIMQYKEQIETTSHISSLLENYIASYKEGTLTYNQAMTGINDLLSQLNQKMPAAENLQNLYDYYGAIKGTAANGDSILPGIQQSLTATAGELVKSLEQYNKNSGAISEYTSSWQQLTDNVASMLRVLKEVRDNLDSADDRDDEEENSHSKGEPYMGGAYVIGGPGDTFKDGIANGLVGTSSTSNREAKMKLLGLKKLDTDEVAAILHKKEAVFNPEQQDMLLSNLGQAWNYTPSTPSFITDSSNRSPQSITNFDFGDINIEQCSNAEELAQGILNGGLRSAMIQQTGKR
jgi:hypothetical protein